ncbi:MAG: hypothetical protein ABID54_00790 [Pseudomonadota bacterium]
MSNIDFFKMSGSGNDFIVVDNRSGILDGDNLNQFVKEICQRIFIKQEQVTWCR